MLDARSYGWSRETSATIRGDGCSSSSPLKLRRWCRYKDMTRLFFRWHSVRPGVLRFYLGRKVCGDLWWFGCEIGYEDLFLLRVSLEGSPP